MSIIGQSETIIALRQRPAMNYYSNRTNDLGLAGMTGISIVILALLIVSPAWAACSDAKLAEVRTTGAKTVAIDCDLILAASDTISTRLVLLGKAATGITVDCQGAQLTSGIVIRSRSYIEDGVRKWEPVKNATIKNCNIVGVVRIWGMARLAEG